MKKTYDVVNVTKQLDILKCLLYTNTTTTREQAEKIICNKIMEARSVEGMEGYNIAVSISNNQAKKWKSNNKDSSAFVKIYYNEIEYARTHFGLNDTEVSFLIRLSQYLLYEENLLVDDEGCPIDQKHLIKLLNVSRPKASRILSSLESKKAIIRISKEGHNYYVVNPYLMWCGMTINTRLPDVFKEIGYVPMN